MQTPTSRPPLSSQRPPGEPSRRRETSTTTATDSGRLFGLGIVGGMAGGLALAGLVMVYGLFSSSRSFFDAPMAIWSWAFGLEHYTRNEPAEHVFPVILGTGAHMVNAAIFGLIIAVLLAAVRDRTAGAILGIGMGLLIWIAMRYVVLPANSGEAELFTTSAVAPQWLWWTGHAAFGAVAGAIVTMRPPMRTEAEVRAPTEYRRAA